MLEEALGVNVVVTKRRQVFRLRGVEVHLDEVDGIGTFVEFEVETKTEEKKIEAFGDLLIGLMYELVIQTESLVEGSYSDMLPWENRGEEGVEDLS